MVILPSQLEISETPFLGDKAPHTAGILTVSHQKEMK